MAPIQVFDNAVAWMDTLLPRDMASQMAEAQSNQMTYAQRSVFSAISLACLGLVAVLATIRCHQFYRLRIINASRVVVVLFYLSSFIAVFVLNHVYNGVGLNTNGNTCKNSILVCIAFYIISKFLLYIFMHERAHAIRAAEYTRLQDKPYIITLVVVSAGIIGVMAYTLWSSMAEMGADDKCRIGLEPRTAGALLAFDLAINLWLTLLFVWQLMTFLKARAQMEPEVSMSSLTRHFIGVTNFKSGSVPQSQPESPQDIEIDLVALGSETRVIDSLERLVKKSLIGLMLIVIPTSVNLIMFIVMNGMETGFECFLTCTLDITVTASIFHWLTMTPQETHSDSTTEARTTS